MIIMKLMMKWFCPADLAPLTDELNWYLVPTTRNRANLEIPLAANR